ncbi:glycosyltransferase family 4 protein [Pontibacter sp. G13]|uniref:glycosyltransferase family 4 protein n=1 Tax=Pontibacter sp. G13 TaxID=3074898 RepID=UPI00288A93BF|nr:glycosyltransferase family 4 protein [Pontibacter sp. G13]WNJ16407.1 glycosyltransferase family 4 protein [Pontibacter sp. G13]
MPKDILILYTKDTQELRNRRSALGSYIASLAKLLQKDGHRVRINDILFNDLVSMGADVMSPAYSQSGLKAQVMKFVPKYLKQWVKDKMMIRRADEFIQLIQNQDPADIILDFYTFGSRTGQALATKWNCPHYVVYDGPVLEEYAFFQGIEAPMAKQAQARQKDALSQANGVVVYSQAMADYVQSLAELSDQRTLHLHQNVDFSRFEFCDEKPTPNPIEIGFIGSFLPWHRVDLLVAAFERLREAGHSVKLNLIGYGMKWENIQQHVENSPFKADISMPGFKDKEELFQLKKQMHIGVVPSAIWYQAPNKLFEYGAMRIACVAPPTPTISFLYEENVEITFFENNDLDSLYQALESLVTNPDHLMSMGKAIQSKIKEDYGPEKTLAFYQMLLGLEREPANL